MPRIVREADVTWAGNRRRARVGCREAPSSSGAFELPSRIASRVGDPEGKTSPEELLAAAHATCFVTSLGSELARAGTPPERLTVRCTITMDEVEGGGHRIVAVGARARAAPGADAAGSRRPPRRRTQAARSRRCIKASATVTVEATLEGGRDAAERTANVTWSGSLLEGAGTIDSVGSGAFGPLDVTWASRTEDAGRTHEPGGADRGRARVLLLDGALERAREGGHAARAARDLGHRDVRARNRDHEERARPSAARFRGWTRTRSAQAAEGAKENCPVSKALAAVPEITLDASLA